MRFEKYVNYIINIKEKINIMFEFYDKFNELSNELISLKIIEKFGWHKGIKIVVIIPSV